MEYTLWTVDSKVRSLDSGQLSTLYHKLQCSVANYIFLCSSIHYNGLCCAVQCFILYKIVQYTVYPLAVVWYVKYDGLFCAVQYIIVYVLFNKLQYTVSHEAVA